MSKKEPGPGKKNKKNKLNKDGKDHNKDNEDKNKKRKHLILETDGGVRGGDSDKCATKKSYLEEKKDDGSPTKTHTTTGTATLSNTTTKDGDQLSSFSEDELIRELAKRRAVRFQLYSAAKYTTSNQKEPDGGIEDATGQYCIRRDGRDGSIGCTELIME